MQAETVLTNSPVIPVSNLDPVGKNRFRYRTTNGENRKLAGEIGAVRVNSMLFEGRLAREDGGDWLLDAHLNAHVVQECVATLQHVATRVRTRVCRTFVRQLSRLSCRPDHKIPDDDSLELLGDGIDLYALARESLLLELPPYPRAGVDRDFVIGSGGEGLEEAEDEPPLSGLAEIYRLLKD